jgi:hypothetical protein
MGNIIALIIGIGLFALGALGIWIMVIPYPSTMIYTGIGSMSVAIFIAGLLLILLGILKFKE